MYEKEQKIRVKGIRKKILKGRKKEKKGEREEEREIRK